MMEGVECVCRPTPPRPETRRGENYQRSPKECHDFGLRIFVDHAETPICAEHTYEPAQHVHGQSWTTAVCPAQSVCMPTMLHDTRQFHCMYSQNDSRPTCHTCVCRRDSCPYLLSGGNVLRQFDFCEVSLADGFEQPVFANVGLFARPSGRNASRTAIASLEKKVERTIELAENSEHPSSFLFFQCNLPSGRNNSYFVPIFCTILYLLHIPRSCLLYLLLIKSSCCYDRSTVW